MRSSTFVALAAVAAAAPAFGAPISTPQYTRRGASSSSPEDQSDAISLSTISTIASVAAPIVSGIIDHFKNK